MKRTLLTLATSLTAGLLLTACAAGTEPTATASPSSSPSTAVTDSPSAQPETMPDAEDDMTLVPDNSVSGEAEAHGAATAEDARSAVEAIEDELEKLSEVTDAQVMLIGDTAAVALKFDSQYQGGIDDRMREIVQERIDGVISGIETVEITDDDGLMDELEKLGDRLEDAVDLTELRAELDTIIQRITGDQDA